ncbi:MAG TPA: hypothetical protein HA349_10370 [Methanotrichaceae archaeon]|nr:hypothetical protein [Methanotrichaceae archaeon]
MPKINSVLKAGDDGQIMIEVLIHLNTETVRGIARAPTQGLDCGSLVTILASL